MIREEIINLIEKSIKKLQKAKKLSKFDIPSIKVERPENQSYGDYATNIALVVSPKAKKKPLEIANILVSEISGLEKKIFKKVETINPGFINFFLSEKYLQRKIKEIFKKNEEFGTLNIGKNKKTNIEFISANPTGVLHVGNGRGAFFGDCLANILEKAGYRVSKEYYINDAKSSSQIQELGRTALGNGKSYLTPYLKNKILDLSSHLKKIKSETDAGYFLAQNILGDVRKFIQNKIKINFDFWTSENKLYRQDKIKKTYVYLKNKSLVCQKDNAFWLKMEKFNQKDEVLIRANGQATYFLSDIAYHKDKIDRGFKKIIDIWGADHQGHVPRIKAVMEILGYRGELDVLITQIVRLKKGKMSKRTGEVITLEWLIDEVGLDAARFFYLMKSLESQMEFDVELAKEKSKKSPVYYTQYAHARICSILKKAKNKEFKKEIGSFKSLNHPSELKLIKEILKLPEIIEDTSKDYQVQRLPYYAINLASSFHQFYRDCRVLSENEELTKARLLLAFAVKITLKNILNLMGVSAPERM